MTLINGIRILKSMIKLKEKGKYTYEVTFSGKYIGDFMMDSDGEYYYWPNDEIKRAWSSSSLKLITQKLDELNNEIR